MFDSLWDTDYSTPGFPVLHHLSEFAQIHVHWVGDTLLTILSSASPFFSCPQSFPASGSFPVSCLFTSGGQSLGASAAASVLPMNIQRWFPLELTSLISLQSKELSGYFLCYSVPNVPINKTEITLASFYRAVLWMSKIFREGLVRVSSI